MWFPGKPKLPEKSLTKRLRDDYWFWESILGNLSARFAGHQTDGPLIGDVLGSTLLQTNADEERLLKKWDNGGWAADLESGFSQKLKEIRRWENRLDPYLTRAQSREEWKAFAESVWDFIRDSRLDTILVMELLSNRSEGEAWEKLAGVLEEWTESEKTDDPMIEELADDDDGPETSEEREEAAAERAREWQSFAEAKGNLREQMAWAVGFREVAGGYYTNRHLTNAIRKIINDHTDQRETLTEYARTINEEITKKRREFGLPVD